jgi:aminopeptidase-like protein
VFRRGTQNVKALPFLPLIEELCAFESGVVCPDNRALFERLQKELPFNILGYPSGSVFNGWEIPLEWRVKKALIKKDGRVVFDGRSHVLGVARYSESFRGRLTLAELDKHLVSDPGQPQAHLFHCAWQYRPWDADWAFCLPHDLRKQLQDGLYEIELETEKKPGNMLVAEYELPGKSDQVILLNSNTCHPGMANDGFCGAALFIRLLQNLRKKDRHYSYRLILAPEHLGSVFYMKDRSRKEIENLTAALFIEMLGTEAPLKATRTFLGEQDFDKVLRLALRDAGAAFVTAPWREGAGNDETVWEAPGYEIPCVELTRAESVSSPFPGYHTSLDNPSLMREEKLQESYRVLENMIFILEHNACFRRRFEGLICLSNPRYDLYRERPDPAVDKTLPANSENWGRLQDSLLRYFDGRHSLLDIALRHDVPFRDLQRYLTDFEEKGLVFRDFKPLKRPPLSVSS